MAINIDLNPANKTIFINTLAALSTEKIYTYHARMEEEDFGNYQKHFFKDYVKERV